MQNQIGKITITGAAGQPVTLEVAQALLLSLVPVYPDPRHLLARVNELLGGELGVSALEPLLTQGWLTRYIPPVPPHVAQATTPELLMVTATGWEVQQTLFPHSDASAYADTTGMFLEGDWLQWATGNAIMAGNACKDTLYGYQVCWHKMEELRGVLDAGVLNEVEHLVLMHPRHGRKVVRLGIFCRTSARVDPIYLQENLEDSGQGYLDAAYFITPNTAVASGIAGVLEQLLVTGYCPPHGLSVGVFALESLVRRWLPAPEHWLEWGGQPPAHLHPAVPTILCKPKPAPVRR